MDVTNLLGEQKRSVVEFTASWCSVCKKFAPTFEKLSSEFKDINFFTIDIDEIQKDNPSFIMETVPRFYFYKDSKLINITIGADEVEIRTNIANILAEPKSYPQLPNAKVTPLTEELILAGQPSYEQLQNLGAIGVRSVINLRSSEEADFLHDESDICTKSGIAYINLSVRSPKEITPEFVDMVASKMKEVKGPFLLHCKGGLRAAVVALLIEGKNAGASAEDVISWGGLEVECNITQLEGLGYKVGGDEKLVELLNTYLKKQ